MMFLIFPPWAKFQWPRKNQKKFPLSLNSHNHKDSQQINLFQQDFSLNSLHQSPNSKPILNPRYQNPLSLPYKQPKKNQNWIQNLIFKLSQLSKILIRNNKFHKIRHQYHLKANNRQVHLLILLNKNLNFRSQINLLFKTLVRENNFNHFKKLKKNCNEKKLKTQ